MDPLAEDRMLPENVGLQYLSKRSAGRNKLWPERSAQQMFWRQEGHRTQAIDSCKSPKLRAIDKHKLKNRVFTGDELAVCWKSWSHLFAASMDALSG